jgi:hypothetical protein
VNAPGDFFIIKLSRINPMKSVVGCGRLTSSVSQGVHLRSVHPVKASGFLSTQNMLLKRQFQRIPTLAAAWH